jgi:hypothetical protein
MKVISAKDNRKMKKAETSPVLEQVNRKTISSWSVLGKGILIYHVLG